MRTSNNLAKIRRTGLNAFGEPYTGNAIRGVQNRRMMGGGLDEHHRNQVRDGTAATALGANSLSSRPSENQRRTDAADAAERAEQAALRRAGMARAQAALGGQTPAAPQAAPALPPPPPAPSKPAPLAQARRKSSARFQGLTFTEMQQRKKRGGPVFVP